MMARSKPTKTDAATPETTSRPEPSDRDRELLLIEYRQTLDGYKSRDQLIPNEFAKMLQVFVIFLALLAGAKVFMDLDRGFAIVILLLLGISGFVALFAFLVSIEACTSCKKALRLRGRAIEYTLGWPVNATDPPSKDGKTGGTTESSYWTTIQKRPKYPFERLMKWSPEEDVERSSATAFIVGAWMLLVIWLVLVIVVLFWGHALGGP